MHYYLDCLKCKKSIKVTIKDYHLKRKNYCKACLQKTFNKLKKN